MMDHQAFAQLLGNYGEFVGSVAVLATLVYLAIQTRQTARIAAGQAAREAMADFQSVWGQLGADAEFPLLIRRAVNEWEALSRNEQMRAHAFFCNLLAHLDSAMRQVHLAEIRRLHSNFEDNVLGFIQTPGGRAWWSACQYLFNADLRESLNCRLEATDFLPPSWTSGMAWWNLDHLDTPAVEGRENSMALR